MKNQKFLSFLEALLTKENKPLVESIAIGYIAIHENDSEGGVIANDDGMKMHQKETKSIVTQTGDLARQEGLGDSEGVVSRALRRLKKHETEEDETEDEETEDKDKEKKSKKDSDDDVDELEDENEDDFQKLVKKMKKKIKQLHDDED